MNTVYELGERVLVVGNQAYLGLCLLHVRLP